MGDIVPFEKRTGSAPDNRISLKPWEFRFADWDNNHFIQMLKSQAAKLETHRRELHIQGEKGIRHLPPHYVLKDGMDHTVRAIYLYRNDEGRMREVYYLAGLIDCMINQVNPLLRTNILKDIYQKVMTMKSLLNVNWYGTIHHVLLPIDSHFFNECEYRQSLSIAGTLKDLYHRIREGTDDMFVLLSHEYIFYTPGRRPS